MDTLRIQNLTVDCVVGVYPDERHTPQPLTVEVLMRLNTEAAATQERISKTVDYAAMADQLSFLLRTCEFRLLETAAHALARYLLCPPAPDEKRAAIASVEVTLSKPGALDGEAFPSITIARDASWYQGVVENRPFGTVDVIHETRDAGIYRLNIAPGAQIPLHIHQQMSEAEMILGDGILCQGEPCPAGTVNRWKKGERHVYDNPGDKSASILCVDRPPFIESDEILI